MVPPAALGGRTGRTSPGPRPVPAPTPPAGVLLVQPDARVRTNLQAAFRAHGYRVTVADTGRDALVEGLDPAVDVLLLDPQLPDVDALRVCRTLRGERPELVIVVLADQADDLDVIAGLDAGADDYLTAPVGLIALVARVGVRLSRRPRDRRVTRVLECGDLVVDPMSRRCTLAGQQVELRLKHFDLLTLLAREAGRTVRRDDLILRVWGEQRVGSSKTLDVHVASLRQRLADAARRADRPVLPPQIRTVRGTGYRLESRPASRLPG